MERKKLAYAIISLLLIICDYHISKYLWNEWINRPISDEQFSRWFESYKVYFNFLSIFIWGVFINISTYSLLSIFIKTKSFYKKGIKVTLTFSPFLGLAIGMFLGLFISMNDSPCDYLTKMFLSMAGGLVIALIFSTTTGLIMEYKIRENQIK
jgi:hypothetical protein